MKVLDFINTYVDHMNERDFFNILNGLADAYAASLAGIGVESGKEIHDSALLSGFLLQDIKEASNGEFALAKDASIQTLRFLNKLVAADNGLSAQ